MKDVVKIHFVWRTFSSLLLLLLSIFVDVWCVWVCLIVGLYTTTVTVFITSRHSEWRRANVTKLQILIVIIMLSVCVCIAKRKTKLLPPTLPVSTKYTHTHNQSYAKWNHAKKKPHTYTRKHIRTCPCPIPISHSHVLTTPTEYKTLCSEIRLPFDTQPSNEHTHIANEYTAAASSCEHSLARTWRANGNKQMTKNKWTKCGVDT